MMKKIKNDESIKEINESMDQIELQIGRCAAITQAILKFGRQSEPNPQDILVDELISEILKMVEKKAAVHNISIISRFDKTPLKVYGEPSELQQVLLNLLNNAMDAIDEDPNTYDGQILLSSGKDGDGLVRIEIKDNGAGISQENLKKVFSPFFTTKPVGKGTGLGLSVCYGIIHKMGGRMEVESTQKMGTTFTISLPEAA